jgi:ATP-dependent DNA ligase
MISLPTLYKLNRPGKIRKWDISIVNEDESCKVVTKFGDIGYKVQTHTRIIEKGKANRTIVEQATLEAKSKWNEKKNRETYSETIDIQHNENKPSFRPMLANTFDMSLYDNENKSRSFKLTFPVLVQPKLDGIRCVSSKNTEDKIVMNSRKGVEIHNFDDIKNEMDKLYSFIGSNDDMIFDGELFTTILNFETISGIVRQENNCPEKKMLIEYHIYDVYDARNPECPFVERQEFLHILFKSLTLKTIKQVPTFPAENLTEINTSHKMFVEDGFEGVMIREKNGHYEVNKRSKFLQKHKSFLEEEFEIIGFHDGEGHDKNMVIWECKTTTGKKFSVKPRGTFEERRIMFTNASTNIGKNLTVTFQEYSADGIPRFPVGKSIRDMSF